jgi:hypothetical protein
LAEASWKEKVEDPNSHSLSERKKVVGKHG